jgi:hypothetical protein
LRGGSGLLNGRRGFFFRHRCSGFIPLPGQVRRFPAKYTSRLPIKVRLPHQVLLGKIQHLQARTDYRHGWGAKDTGDVDQSRLGRRLLLRLCGRCLFRSSSGGFRAPLSSRGLALHLCQELFYSGGWAATTFSFLPHRVPYAFVSLLNGLGRWHLLQARKLRHQHATQDISTRLHCSRWLTSWDVVSMTFNFLATRLRATLRGFLGGAGRLASRLAG